jgi:hypothetical protein
MSGYFIVWEDAKMVGFRCAKAPVGVDATGTLDAEERASAVCETCGKTIRLHWDVRIVEVGGPDAEP